MKVVGDRRSNLLLGATLCGPEASDLVAEAALALDGGVPGGRGPHHPRPPHAAGGVHGSLQGGDGRGHPRRDGRSSILCSHLPWGDNRRGWNFRSLGHGDVDFDAIIRELNDAGYQGPLSVEWEDAGMEREYGAREALAFVRRVDFAPSRVAFDDAFQQK